MRETFAEIVMKIDPPSEWHDRAAVVRAVAEAEARVVREGREQSPDDPMEAKRKALRLAVAIRDAAVDEARANDRSLWPRRIVATSIPPVERRRAA